MNIDQGLVFGIFLILAGVVLAIFAYLAFSGKDPVPPISPHGEGEDEDEVDAQESVVVEVSHDIPTLEEPSEESPPASEQPPESSPVVPVASPEPIEEVTSQPTAGEIDPHLEVPPKPPTDIYDEPRIQVASLLRDEITGSLIVQVGGQEFLDPEELRDSPYWTRVEYAANDLATWIKAEEKAEPATPRMREPDTTPVRPLSMIGQINDILQEKITEQGGKHQGVQLIEGPGGSARVLIGVQSYELGEVPDEEIQNLIREAVAAWEQTQ